MKKDKLQNIKTSGFKIPEAYFSNVEERVRNEVRVKDKADQSGFQVPENYFDTLDDHILSRLEHETPVINLKSQQVFYYVAGIAASLIVMFNVFYTPETITIGDVETVSIENYLEVEDYTTYELASLLTEEDLKAFNLINSEISETTIEDYLLDHATIEELIIE
ncbi:MAG: hypothetical protein GYB35_11345 [Algicola sp.]|nr:hypothetical protein [Algicola sp.]